MPEKYLDGHQESLHGEYRLEFYFSVISRVKHMISGGFRASMNRGIIAFDIGHGRFILCRLYGLGLRRGRACGRVGSTIIVDASRWHSSEVERVLGKDEVLGSIPSASFQ